MATSVSPERRAPGDAAAIAWACAACGAPPDSGFPGPFRCRHAGRDDLDHVLTRRLDPRGLRFAHADPNPFVRHRELLTAWHALRAGGHDDSDFLAMVEGLDRAIAACGGRGFFATPFHRSAALSERLGFDGAGGVWIKDETGNVGGSHKGRHLMAVILHLEAMERLGHLPRGSSAPPLAIASCGNAALAGAVLARAANRRLRVFVPEDADASILARLRQLGAEIESCTRVPGPGDGGDPSIGAFRRAVAAGAIPFSCQGSECALAIEGGETLAWEMIATLAAEGLRIDRLFVQVGGGALASACIQAFHEASDLGIRAELPRVHAVQSAGVAPLMRAYLGVRACALQRLEQETGGVPATLAGLGESSAGSPHEDAVAAEWLRVFGRSAPVDAALREAQQHRSRYMWPWNHTGRHSTATGILDDETYDWHAVVAGMIRSGGFPVVADEAAIADAHTHAAEATGFRASRTGTAGLAGLIDLRRRGLVRSDERVAVLFTGAERPSTPL